MGKSIAIQYHSKLALREGGCIWETVFSHYSVDVWWNYNDGSPSVCDQYYDFPTLAAAKSFASKIR